MGIKESYNRLSAMVEGCKTPGKKLRSKGKGMGLAIGKGNGPIGVPIGQKAEATTTANIPKTPGVKMKGIFSPRQSKRRKHPPSVVIRTKGRGISLER